jgi:pimeloyl-ACP methyl ester carboxylesterase
MSLHFELAGGGSNTLVLTHGLAANTGTWKAQVPSLSAKSRVLTWDLRGHGRSAAPEGPYALGDLAGDLARVLDRAAVERAVVLGHSAGGVVAMRFALDHPERTAGLVLVGTASECNERARDFYEELAKIAEQRGMGPVHRRLGIAEAADAPGTANPAAFAKVARCMANLHREPLTPRLGEIRCPALIIVGDKDFLGAGGSVILSRRIAGSRLHIVPERGHGIFAEDPGAFNGLVQDFLAEIE